MRQSSACNLDERQMNENYSDWEFMLNGNQHELRHFSESRGTAFLSIYGGIDHWHDCPSDDFRMVTMFAQDEADLNTVWQLGYELLSLYNGASELLKMKAPKLSIHRLLHKEVQMDYMPENKVVGLLGNPGFPRARIAVEEGNARKLSPKFSLLHLATSNQDVLFTLKYLDMEPSWDTYYKLMETLEGFAKTRSIDLGTDAGERSSFTNTANNFSLAGFGARHGFKQAVKANKTPSMQLDQAHAFVTSMAKSYLKQAHGLRLANTTHFRRPAEQLCSASSWPDVP